MVEMTVSTFQTLGFAPGQTTARLGQFTERTVVQRVRRPGGNVDARSSWPDSCSASAPGCRPGGRLGTATSIVAGAALGRDEGIEEIRKNTSKVGQGYQERHGRQRQDDARGAEHPG
jgi:hypothetical protein